MTKEELADQLVPFRVRTLIGVLVASFLLGGSSAGILWKLSTIGTDVADLKAAVVELRGQVASIQRRLGVDEYRAGERDVAKHEQRD